jgi:hypothetical protein
MKDDYADQSDYCTTKITKRYEANMSNDSFFSQKNILSNSADDS